MKIITTREKKCVVQQLNQNQVGMYKIQRKSQHQGILTANVKQQVKAPLIGNPQLETDHQRNKKKSSGNHILQGKPSKY